MKFMTLSEFRDGGYRDITEPVTVLSVRGRVDVLFVAMPPSFDPGALSRPRRPSVAQRTLASTTFGPLGLRPAYVTHELLAVLADGPLTYAEAGAALGRTRDAIKVLVRRLEGLGLLERRRSGPAPAPVRLYLTERAAAAVTVARKVHGAEGGHDGVDHD